MTDSPIFNQLRSRFGLDAHPTAAANPAPDVLADDHDAQDWDRAVHGRMLDHADDDEPATVPWEG